MNKETEIKIEKIKEMRRQGFSLQNIGKVFGVSRQRINQLEKNYSTIINYNIAKIYQRIKERDEYKCKLCGDDRRMKLTIHHIDHNRDNNNELNLMTVCKSCHSRIHITKNQSKIMPQEFKSKEAVLYIKMDKNLKKQLQEYANREDEGIASKSARKAIVKFLAEQSQKGF